MENNELKHYGVLGMRWGVRRSKAQLARASGSRKVTKEQYEAEKQKAIKSGDANKVRAWRDHLTKKEYSDAIEYVNMNRKLSEAEKGTIKSGLEKAENVVNKVGRVTTMGDTLLKAYGLVAKVNNTFNSKQLPSVDGVNYKQKKADDTAKERKEAKVASDTQALYKLIKDGKIDEVRKNMDSYDPDALKNVAQVVENLSKIDKKKKNP